MPISRCGRLQRVAAVHQVLGEQDAEVAADRAGRGLARVGRAHHRAHDLPRVLRALEHHRHDRAAAHEGDEVGVEALADVLLVVAGQRVGVERAQVEGDDASGPWPRSAATISPTRPRSTASGLSRTRVRSDMAGRYRLPAPALVGSRRALARRRLAQVGGRADDVERAGDERRRRRRSAPRHGPIAGLLDGVALDHLVAAERASGRGELARRACRGRRRGAA